MSDHAVVVLAADGRIVTWNAGAERMTGYRAEEIVGQSISCLYPAEDVPADRAAADLARVAAEGRLEKQVWRVRRDGSRFLALVVMMALSEEAGGLSGYACMMRDLSEREQMEGRWRFLAQAGEVLVSSLDYETTLQAVAHLAVPTVADVCMVDLLDAEGLVHRLAVVAEASTDARWTDELQGRFELPAYAEYGAAKVMRTGEPELIEEMPARLDVYFPLLPRGGALDPLATLREMRPRSRIVVPLVAHGQVLGSIMLLTTAASGRRYGQEDLPLAEGLARVAALALDNARLFEAESREHARAEQAVKVRDDLLRLATHDLRNPLTAIVGSVALLRRKMARKQQVTSSDVDQALETILGRARHMTEQIEELLDIAELEAGQPLRLEQGTVDLVALVREVVAEEPDLVAEDRLHVAADVPELRVRGDARRLKHVLTNLVSNAAKYSREGGKIEVTVVREAGVAQPWALVQVRDEGIGIPAEDLPHIFEWFYRASNVRDRLGGRGIGLAGSRDVVSRHGGTISVESAEGIGSTFTLRLPLPVA